MQRVRIGRRARLVLARVASRTKQYGLFYIAAPTAICTVLVLQRVRTAVVGTEYGMGGVSTVTNASTGCRYFSTLFARSHADAGPWRRLRP